LWTRSGEKKYGTMETIKILSTKKLNFSQVITSGTKLFAIEEIDFISIHQIETEQKKKEIRNWLSSDKKFFVFTSANAVDVVKAVKETAGYYHDDRTIFTISGKTSQAAAKLFPQDRIIKADNAAALAAVIELYKAREVVFFCGNKRREELPDVLTEHGISVHEVVVYETTEKPVKLDKTYDAILFFSPSGVHSFFSVNELAANTTCFAIGKTTATILHDYNCNEVIIADKPTQESIMDAVKKYFNQSIARNE
jgi:uroporphyrinogen-III synthase